MTGDLTEHLHAGVETLTVSPRTAEAVRRSAERGRRVRRLVGVCLGSVLVLALGLGSALLRDSSRVSFPAPAQTPSHRVDVQLRMGSQLAVVRDHDVVILIESTGWGERTSRTLEIALERAIPSERGRCRRDFVICGMETPRRRPWVGRHILASDPLLTEADWITISGVPKAGDQRLHRTDAGPQQLTECVTDPRTSQVSESFAAAYSVGGDINEFVLRYPDVKTASRAVATMKDRFLTCPGHRPASDWGLGLGLGGWTVDEFFVAER